MQSGILRSVAVAAVLILGIAGCGGGGANQSEPAGAVKAALDAAQAGGIAKFADFACAAKKSDITGLFGGQGIGNLAALGISPNDAFGAAKVEFKDIQTAETSKSGDSAVVHVTGTMSLTLDPTKLRDLMKKVMAANGQTVDDATLDSTIALMSTQLTQSQPMNEDVTVVQEGGKWLVC